MAVGGCGMHRETGGGGGWGGGGVADTTLMTALINS